MKNVFKKLSLLLLLVATTLSLSANNIHGQGVVINEILVNNVDNYEDGYGHKLPWIELKNDSHTRVDVSSYYFELRVDGHEPVRYRIPKGNAGTSLAAQDYTLFFCGGSATKGTFHTNFTLGAEYLTDPAQSELWSTLVLYSANGRDTIDFVRYNIAAMKEDTSYGRMLNHDDEYEIRLLSETTPYATNDTEDAIPNHERIRQADPYGIGLAVTSMCVVFSSLLILYILFRSLGAFMVWSDKRHKARVEAHLKEAKGGAAPEEDAVFSGEIAAAIALAIQKYEEELHDRESTVLTINRVAKVYSPWNSKIYGLRKDPEFKK